MEDIMHSKIIKMAIIFAVLTNIGQAVNAMTEPFKLGLARVVPLSFDQTANEWRILLRHHNGAWHDFYTPYYGSAPTAASAPAEQALKDQTNGMYTVAMNGDIALGNQKTTRIVHRSLYDQGPDIVFFRVVPFIRGNDLFEKGRNTLADDFVWISQAQFAKADGIKSRQGKPINLDPEVQAMLANHLNEAVSYLTPAK